MFKKVFCMTLVIFENKNCVEITKYILKKMLGFNINPNFIFQDFVTGLSLSLYGSREEKMKWAFQLYDLDGDGCITREVSMWGM